MAGVVISACFGLPGHAHQKYFLQLILKIPRKRVDSIFSLKKVFYVTDQGCQMV
jgi:hypothetical protein